MNKVLRFEDLIACRKRENSHQFLSTAKGSCGELRSLLYGALDVGYVGESVFTPLMLRAQEVGRIVGGLRKAVEAQRDSQRKG